MKKQKGFSLIELLIVVAIILIIAAIAIPNLMRARIAANESSGASQLRTLNTAEVSYSTAYSAVGYGTQAHLGGRYTMRSWFPHRVLDRQFSGRQLQQYRPQRIPLPRHLDP